MASEAGMDPSGEAAIDGVLLKEETRLAIPSFLCLDESASELATNPFGEAGIDGVGLMNASHGSSPESCWAPASSLLARDWGGDLGERI